MAEKLPSPVQPGSLLLSFPPPRPVPMVEMCEGWNSLSVKRHNKQVLPTPESPMSSRRKSTSYCLAMAGAGRASAPRCAGCHPSRTPSAPGVSWSGAAVAPEASGQAGKLALQEGGGGRGDERTRAIAPLRSLRSTKEEIQRMGEIGGGWWRRLQKNHLSSKRGWQGGWKALQQLLLLLESGG